MRTSGSSRRHKQSLHLPLACSREFESCANSLTFAGKKKPVWIFFWEPEDKSHMALSVRSTLIDYATTRTVTKPQLSLFGDHCRTARQACTQNNCRQCSEWQALLAFSSATSFNCKLVLPSAQVRPEQDTATVLAKHNKHNCNSSSSSWETPEKRQQMNEKRITSTFKTFSRRRLTAKSTPKSWKKQHNILFIAVCAA